MNTPPIRRIVTWLAGQEVEVKFRYYRAPKRAVADELAADESERIELVEVTEISRQDVVLTKDQEQHLAAVCLDSVFGV